MTQIEKEVFKFETSSPKKVGKRIYDVQGPRIKDCSYL